MMRRILAFACLLVLPAAVFAQASDEWDFAVALDGKPIGTHRFVVSGPSEARSVDSRADMVVRMLGIPVYRYRHRAEERWQGNCLRELNADTDDDGKRQQVAQRFDSPACLMGFSYWNPKLVQQRQLVDPQTGRVTEVRFEAVADGSIDVRDRKVPAHGWLLLADKQRITVWYAADTGRWIGLDADAKGGRRLSYRIPPEKAPP